MKTHAWSLATGAVLVVAVIAGVLGGDLARPAHASAAATPTATGGAPITVVIPGASTASPSTTSGQGSNGGSNGGTGGQPSGSGGTNPDGSPIPPDDPKSNAPRLKLDKDSVGANGWVIATASGYQPGEKAQLVLYPGAIVIASYTVGPDGEFSARFRIPADTPTGAHVVEVTGWTSGYVTNAELTVTAAGAAPNWLTLWWVYVVLGVLFVALLSLAIAFRSELARWFGGRSRGGMAS